MNVRLAVGLLSVAFLSGPIRADEQVVPPTRYGKQFALIVGINYGGTNNKHFLPRLNNAERDAEAVKDRLVRWYGYDQKNVVLLTGPKATKQVIEAGLDDILDRAGSSDSILFYFSGHGERSVNVEGKPYGLLVPFDAKWGVVDGQEQLKPLSCFHYEDLVTVKLSIGQARHVLVILDCCYSGQVLVRPNATRGLRVAKPFDAEGFNARGIQAITAGLSSRRVADGGGEHSPFTQALLDALEQQPAQLPDGATSFTTYMLFAKIQEGMKDLIAAGKAQPLCANITGDETGAEANFHFFPDFAKVQQAQPPHSPVAAPLRFDLQSITGLNGQWWFEESPWLIPAARDLLSRDLKLAERRLDEGSTLLVTRDAGSPPWSVFLDPDTYRVHQLLRAEIDKKKAFQDRDDVTARLFRDMYEVPARFVERDLQNYARELEDNLQGSNGTPKPQDWHLLAVLQHRLNASAAHDSYERARAQYAQETPVKTGLLALCLNDDARLHFNQKRYSEAVTLYREAEDLVGGEPSIFLLDCLANRSDAHRRLGQWRETEECLSRAITLARGSLPPNHPLRAYAFEKKGWAKFERWHVTEAIQAFEQAQLVFDDGSTPDRLGSQARITLFRILHGRAMAERFAGFDGLKQAQERFRKIDEEIEQYINSEESASKLTTTAKQALLERQVNTRERWADSYLYAGDFGAASSKLDDAMRLARLFSPEQRDLVLSPERREPILFSLCLKQAMALAQVGKALEAGEALCKADEQRIFPKQFLDCQRYYKLAHALQKKHGGQITAGQQEIRDLVEPAVKLPEERLTQLPRDDLELLLMANLELAGEEQMPENTRRLVSVMLRTHDPALLAYVRPYFNAVIHAMAIRRYSDPNELIRWLFLARTGKEIVSLDRVRNQTALLFHLEEERGLAILLPLGGQAILATFRSDLGSWKRTPKQTTLKPPWGTEFDQALKKSRGKINVFWSDSVMELTDESYPFSIPALDQRIFASYESQFRVSGTR